MPTTTTLSHIIAQVDENGNHVGGISVAGELIQFVLNSMRVAYFLDSPELQPSSTRRPWSIRNLFCACLAPKSMDVSAISASIRKKINSAIDCS